MKNVILLTIDTLRRDVIDLYDDNKGITPFLDSLKEKSLVFTNHYSVAPYTQASFPGILTSSYIFDAPRTQKLSKGRVLISEALRAKGIETAGFHSNPYLCEFFGWNRGWDTFYDSMDDDVDDINPYIKGNIINKKADAWLEKRDKAGQNDPFFMWVHYMDVHEPYVPSGAYIDRIDPSITLSEKEMFNLFQDVLLKRDMSDPGTVELFHKLYLAHVCEIDDYVKNLFDILDRQGILEKTTVIITTDHGDEFGEHGSLSHDGKMYDELVHVPLIVYNPPEAVGTNCKTLVSGLDISPTVMALFGLDPHKEFQGQSLFPLTGYKENGVYGEAIGKLSHKIKTTDKPAYFHRADDLKIMYREEEDSWELYNLVNDPGENKNVIDLSPAAEEMKQKLSPRIGRTPRYQ